MWGNRRGWTISALMTLATLGVFIWVVGAFRITAPTNLSLDNENLAEFALPEPAVGLDRNQPGDAGDLYRTAINAYESARQPCDQYVQNPTGTPPEPIRLVLDASHRSVCHLFLNNPTRLVNYQPSHQELDTLLDLGRIIDQAGLVMRMKKMSEAPPFFMATYTLGLNLLHERLVYEEYFNGLSLMNEAGVALAEGEPEASPARTELERGMRELSDYDARHVMPIYHAIASADADMIALHAGDVFRFATHARERMARVEAILKLGRYRFSASRNADQIGAGRIIERLTRDSDPVIQVAATAARDLTIEQYRAIH